MAVLTNSCTVAHHDRAELDNPSEGPNGSDDYITGITERHNTQLGYPVRALAAAIAAGMQGLRGFRLHSPPLAVGQVFAGVVLDLMLVNLFDVIRAARLPIDQLSRRFPADRADIRLPRVLFFDVQNLLYSFFQFFHLALTSGHGHLRQRLARCHY